jgi:inner membrane protein
MAIAFAAGRGRMARPVALAGVVLSMLPDLDSIGFRFGIAYDSPWGHRGFTHSIALAFVMALLLTLPRWPGMRRPAVFGFFFASMVSHGLLDAMTNGGLGVAFFWPVSETRYFFPWQGIEVSPISIARFFSDRGAAVLKSEFVWIWLPSFAVAALVRTLRRRYENEMPRVHGSPS